MLHLSDISHQYDGKPVLRDIDLTLEDGEILCLLGQSGSGKTTLLRIVAGLEPNFSGELLLSGESLTQVPVHQRGFGLVFQDFALFPHLTVAQNVAFGLETLGLSAKERQQRMSEMLQLVKLDEFGDRDVGQLSGGEKQRVALARSLAPRPRLLMLDEPLGSLDAGLRNELVLELREIIKEMGVSALYVTHDQQEAFAVADRVAVMHDGVIDQVDTPQQIYRHPQTVFVARFLGLTNIVPKQLIRPLLSQTSDANQILLHPVGLHQEDMGTVRGTVETLHFQGSRYEITVRIAEEHVLFYWQSLVVPVPEIGAEISLAIAPEWILPLEG